jgi:hypothetical protein
MKMPIRVVLVAASLSCSLFGVEPIVGLREIAESPVMMTDVRSKALFLQRIITDDAKRISVLIVNPFGAKPRSSSSALILMDGMVCAQVSVKNTSDTGEQPLYGLDATHVLAYKNDGAERSIRIIDSSDTGRDRMRVAIGSDLVVLKLRLPVGGGVPEIECELGTVPVQPPPSPK